MITALVLLVVVIITNYLPKIPFIQDFMNEKGSLWVKIYLEIMLNLCRKTALLRGEVVAVLAILPVIAMTYLLNYSFYASLKELGNIIFMVATLYYCLSCVTEAEDEHESVFILGHERIFGIIFWFTIFGATGAMFYWLLTASKMMSNKIVLPIANFDRGLNIIHALAAWLPARITGLIYALVGDFVQGFDCWCKCMRTAKIQSSQVLLDCGQASLHSVEAEDALVERALVAWIIVGVVIELIIAEVRLG